MKIREAILITAGVFLTIGPLTGNDIVYGAEGPGRSIELSAESLRDKIRGGLLGQLLGNLNGLKHEMKYIAEPGNVKEYTPALPEGAWTDDDTDLNGSISLRCSARMRLCCRLILSCNYGKKESINVSGAPTSTHAS